MRILVQDFNWAILKYCKNIVTVFFAGEWWIDWSLPTCPISVQWRDDCLGALRGDRVNKVHQEQTVRVLDTEHGPWVAALTVPFATGKHHVLVPPSGYAGYRTGSHGIPVRWSWHHQQWRAQIQGVGVSAQVLRDRRTGPRLHDQLDGVGWQLFLPSFWVNFVLFFNYLVVKWENITQI